MTAREPLDVVDEEDRVVGSVPRAEVHRRGLLHRSVHVFLLDRSGRLFVQRRAPTVVVHPNRWTSSASGHVDAGESYEDAAVRELSEEIGVCADVRLRGRFRYRDAVENEWSALFEAHYDGEVALDAAEVAEGRFVTLDELARWIAKDAFAFSPSFLTALACWRQAGGKGGRALAGAPPADTV
ncbi:MAG TPA: NUDIX domain-containing protein [Candidatus Thermoplasmatota archaeon]|nr:NUDIX domain-containing protein [Candidatus Thermoplasmatota archaeon]